MGPLLLQQNKSGGLFYLHLKQSDSQPLSLLNCFHKPVQSKEITFLKFYLHVLAIKTLFRIHDGSIFQDFVGITLTHYTFLYFILYRNILNFKKSHSHKPLIFCQSMKIAPPPLNLNISAINASWLSLNDSKKKKRRQKKGGLQYHCRKLITNLNLA